MPQLALILAAAFAFLTVLALALVVLALVRRVRDLTSSLRAIQERLEPALSELDRETAVAQRQLARLADAAEDVSGGARGGRAPR